MPGSEALTGEGLTDYYMIVNDNLPILEPLLLIPGIGQPLHDLLEPDTQILVNLGYGSITEGWNQGLANVPTTFGLFADINQTQLSDALSNGWQQGVTDALHDLQHPVSYQDQVAPLLLFADSLHTVGVAPENPSFTDVVDGLLNVLGFPVSDVMLSSSPTDIINDISATLSYDYSSLLPLADAINGAIAGGLLEPALPRILRLRSLTRRAPAAVLIPGPPVLGGPWPPRPLNCHPTILSGINRT